MVAVLTQGTLTDPEMLRSHADASYVLSIAEQPAKELSGQPSIGVCAVDCATGQILVGNWYDFMSQILCRCSLWDYMSS
jgi:DNA mismatch repair protein MSH6